MISGTEVFEETVREGVVAARAGYVVTIGIRATEPSTAFGYVRSGPSLGLDDAPRAQHVVGFTEKPDAETAAAYLATGEYRWNAGMFLVKARVLLDHLAVQLPAARRGSGRDRRGLGRSRRGPAVLDRVWPGLTKIAIDHAIAEPVAAAGGVAVVPGDFTWDDVGDFASLAALLDGGHARRPSRRVQRIDVRRIARRAPATGGPSRSSGMPDAVVVDTPGAVLVTTRAHAQAVKQARGRLARAGRDDLL